LPTKVVFVGGETLGLAEDVEEVHSRLRGEGGGRVRFERPLGDGTLTVYLSPDHVLYLEDDPPSEYQAAGPG
jgi:hypothetical protein